MTEQNHIDIVVSGFEEGKSDDEILKELFETGVDFSDLRTIFNDVVKEKGLRLSAKERKAKASELLEGWEPIDSEDMLAKVAMLKDELKVNDSKALSTLRSWAKDNEVTLPKPPRKIKKTKVGFGGHVRKVLDFMKENRDATRKQIQEFCVQSEIPVNYTTLAMNVVAFANEWNGESPEEGSEAA